MFFHIILGSMLKPISARPRRPTSAMRGKGAWIAMVVLPSVLFVLLRVVSDRDKEAPRDALDDNSAAAESEHDDEPGCSN